MGAWTCYQKTWRCASIRQLHKAGQPASYATRGKWSIGRKKNGFWTRCSSVCATLGSELPRPALRPTVNSFVERISAGAEQSSRASSSSTNSLPVCWQAGNLASSRFWPGHVQGSAKGEREPHPALATSLARLFGLDFSRGSRALRLTQWLSKSRLVPKQLQSLQARPVPPPLPCQGSCLRVGRCTRLSEGSVPHRCKQGCKYRYIVCGGILGKTRAQINLS